MFAGQVIVGGSVSITVTVNEQVAPVAVEQWTAVVPLGKNEPEAGVHMTEPHPPIVVGAW
jgi:hypothetical protein